MRKFALLSAVIIGIGSAQAQQINNPNGAANGVPLTGGTMTGQLNANGLNTTATSGLQQNGGTILSAFGTNNLVSGDAAMPLTATGTWNTAHGHAALLSLTTGDSNTAVGTQALKNVDTGNFNVGIGDNAGKCINGSGATGNLAVGHGAMGQDDATPSFCTANYNTALGNWALQDLTTGTGNVAVGTNSMVNASTDVGNTAVGFTTLVAGHSGDTPGLSVGSFNVAIGWETLFNNTASSNTAVGYAAMTANVGGTLSACLGFQCLHAEVTGVRNTGIGYASLNTENGANDNTAVGGWSGHVITTGSNNAILGSEAGFVLTSGAANTLLGAYVAHATLTTGSRNILIGTTTNCDTTASGTNDYFAVCASSGSTHLMTGSLVSASLTLAINAATTITGTLNTTGVYSANGTAGVTCATASPTSSFATVNGIVTHC